MPAENIKLFDRGGYKNRGIYFAENGAKPTVDGRRILVGDFDDMQFALRRHRAMAREERVMRSKHLPIFSKSKLLTAKRLISLIRGKK